MTVPKRNGHGMDVGKGSTGVRTAAIASLFGYFDYPGYSSDDHAIGRCGAYLTVIAPALEYARIRVNLFFDSFDRRRYG
jgi:hypothetical protein